MSKRMKLVFTASLLLNIVLIGIGAGMLFRFCQDVPIPSDMSPEARHFIARTFQNGREQIKPLIVDVKEQRKKVEALLLAEEFNEKAYNEEVEKLLVAQEKITRKRAEIMGDALLDLPAADRQKFAGRIIEGLEPGRPRKGGYHHKMDKDAKQPPVNEEKPDKPE